MTRCNSFQTPEDDLYRSERRTKQSQPGPCDRKMVSKVPEFHETLGAGLGCHHADLQIYADVRAVIYMTNAIESLNATYRKLNRQRSVFLSGQALLKVLYLATFETTKNGRCRSETGGRYMVNWRSCMRTAYQTEQKASQNGRKIRLLLTYYPVWIVY